MASREQTNDVHVILNTIYSDWLRVERSENAAYLLVERVAYYSIREPRRPSLRREGDMNDYSGQGLGHRRCVHAVGTVSAEANLPENPRAQRNGAEMQHVGRDHLTPLQGLIDNCDRDPRLHPPLGL